MSSDAESISGGMHLPGWMKSRIEKNNFDGIPFSPPSHDESFFYIRYPVTTQNENDSGINGVKQITDIFKNNKIEVENSGDKLRHIDFSKHTEPCKKFLKDSPKIPAEEIKNPPKSFGVDDGFKGPGAACGSSIVKVAQQMVSNGSLTTRRFRIANIEQSSSDSDNAFQTKTVEDQQLQVSKPIQPQTELAADNIGELPSFNNQQKQSAPSNSVLMNRRGSKSLPSSPLSSPKSMRKYHPNPYFTTTSLFSSSNSPSGISEGRGWFLSSLLGVQREATSSSSMTHIDEEAHDLLQQNSNNNNNINIKSDNHKVLKAKPSELREMNFWSPTSM